MKRIILLVLISFLSINVVYSYNSNVTAVNPPGCNCNGYLIVTGFSDHWSNSYYWYLYQNGGLLNYSSSYNGSSNVYVASSGVYDVLVILYDAQGTSYPQWHYGLSVSSPPPCQLSSYIVSSNNISNYYCSDGQITVMGNTNTCNNTITYTLYKDGQYYSSGSSVSNQNVQWANLPSGSYSIIADNGYSNTTSTVTLTEPPCDIQANIITSDLVTTGVNCSNGSITWESTSQSCLPLHTVTITKDGNPYNNWNYNFTNGQQSITGLGAGAYDISISNGVCSTSVATQEVEDSVCSIDINYIVTNSTGYNCNNGNINFTGFTNTCNPSTWVATLYKDGAVYNSYIYGIFWWGWNYWWGYNHNFSSLGPGTYELNLYDGECDKSIYFTITEPPCNLAVTIDEVTQLTGANCGNGAITYFPTDSFSCATSAAIYLYKDSVQYGSPQYQTTNGAGPFAFNNLPAGSYYLKIDNGYCIRYSTTVIIGGSNCGINEQLDNVIQQTGQTCGNASFTFTLNDSNACATTVRAHLYKNGYYQYWYQDIAVGGTVTFNNLGAGDYYLDLYDWHCSKNSQHIIITEPDCGIMSSGINSVNTNYNCNNGSVTFSMNDSNACVTTMRAHLHLANGNYTGQYQDVSPGTPVTFSNLAAGQYFISVYDWHCWANSDSLTINTNPCAIDASITLLDSSSSIGCPTGAFDVVTDNSTSCHPYRLMIYKDNLLWWDNYWYYSNQTHNFNSLNPGQYYAVIFNNYCYDTSAVITIQDENPVTFTVNGTTNITGYQCTNGTIDFSISNSNTCDVGIYYYIKNVATGGWQASGGWYTNSMQATATNLPAGNYELWMHNYNGVWFQGPSFGIIDPFIPKPASIFTVDAINNSTGYNCNNGSITFTPTQTNPCREYYTALLYKDGNPYTQIGNCNWWWNWGFTYPCQPYANGQLSFTGLGPGNYHLEINNGNYIDTTYDFTITEPTKPASQTTLDAVVNATGKACNNGSFTFTPIQTNVCRPDYVVNIQKDGSYYTSWGWISYSSGQQTYGGLPPGNYSVEINNGFFLDTTFSFTITEPICDAVITTSAVFNAPNCNGGVINYIINSSSCPNYDIKLYKNNTLFSNTSAGPNSQYSFSNLSAGSYFIVANNGHCSDTSDIVVINNVLTISSSLPNPICNVLIPTFTVTPAIPIASPTYRWRKNGVIMQTSSSPTYTPTSFANGNTITCQLIGTGCNVTSNTLTLQVITCTNANVSVKAFIQGYLNNGMLTTALLNQGESTSSSVSDSITVELCEPIAPYNVVHAYKNELSTNGNINFTLNPNFIGNSYYIVLKHRNSIETWSNNPVLISTLTMYDFTNAASKALGDNQANTNGSFAMFTGDIDQNGYLELDDYNLWDIEYQAGYPHNDYTPDLDGNGYVELDDYNIWDMNYQIGVYTVKP